MGIIRKHLELLAIEKNNDPNFIHGDVLTLGQQSVHATLDEVLTIFTKNKITVNSLPENFDTKNKIPQWVGTQNGNRTNAQTVLTLLGADSVSVADISSYENPDYIIDLNNEINTIYENKYDVIFDIGTLEHIFDVPTALQNITKMLKPRGRVIFILPSSNAIDHGFYQFSPTLFFDFFSCNGFENFNCYLIEGNPLNYLQKGKIWRYTGFKAMCPLITANGVEVFFSGTKNKTPIKFEKPIQSLYINNSRIINSKLNSESDSNTKPMSIFRKFRNEIWKYCPGFIQNKIIKIVRKSDNLVYVGKY